VTFELYDCRVRERYHHHHGNYHLRLMSNLCFFLVLMSVVRFCCCGARRNWGCCRGRVPCGPTACPFLQSAAQPRIVNGVILPSNGASADPLLQSAAPVQPRIVNGVILPSNAASAGPALRDPTAPAPTAPVVQPAGVYPGSTLAAPTAPVYIPMSQPEEDAQLSRALALSVETEESAQLQQALALSQAQAAGRHCPACGAANHESYRFCSACGQPLQPRVSPAAGLQL
jgi:hypothetical protein